MDNRYKWAVEEIYKSVEDWNNNYESLSKNINFDAFRGKLGEKSSFLQCMKEQEKLSRIFEKLSVFR